MRQHARADIRQDLGRPALWVRDNCSGNQMDFAQKVEDTESLGERGRSVPWSKLTHTHETHRAQRGSFGSVEKGDLLSMISSARRELSSAELELDQVVGEIREAMRAEKTGISGAVEGAFAKLRSAKSKLAELEARLSSSDR